MSTVMMQMPIGFQFGIPLGDKVKLLPFMVLTNNFGGTTTMGLREIRQAQIPRDAVMSDDEYFHPTYTTAMSLVIYPHLRLAGGIDSGSPKKAPFIGKVTDFFKSFDLFGGD